MSRTATGCPQARCQGRRAGPPAGASSCLSSTGMEPRQAPGFGLVPPHPASALTPLPSFPLCSSLRAPRARLAKTPQPAPAHTSGSLPPAREGRAQAEWPRLPGTRETGQVSPTLSFPSPTGQVRTQQGSLRLTLAGRAQPGVARRQATLSLAPALAPSARATETLSIHTGANLREFFLLRPDRCAQQGYPASHQQLRLHTGRLPRHLGPRPSSSRGPREQRDRREGNAATGSGPLGAPLATPSPGSEPPTAKIQARPGDRKSVV